LTVFQAGIRDGDRLGTRPDLGRGTGVLRAVRLDRPRPEWAQTHQPPAWSRRDFTDRAGRRAPPDEFDRCSNVCRRFRRWTRAGLGEDMMEALDQSRAVPDALRMIDSTVIRAHHQAAGAGGGPRDRVRAAREVASPPRSIFSSKASHWPAIGPRTMPSGPPMRTEITPGQTSDCIGCDPVMADRGHDPDSIRKNMAARKAIAQIPLRKSRKMRVGVDHSLDAPRNMAERCHDKPKNARRVAPVTTKPPRACPASSIPRPSASRSAFCRKGL